MTTEAQVSDMVLHFQDLLTEFRQSMEEENKFEAAESATGLLDQVQTLDKQRKTFVQRAEHHQEKIELEEAFLVEFNNFNVLWDKNLKEYDDACDVLEIDLAEKHRNEAEELKRSLRVQFPDRPKYSSALRNLKMTKEKMVKHKKYSEARTIQCEIDTKEREEDEKFSKQKRLTAMAQERQLQKRHETEREALGKRIASGREEFQKSRGVESQRLVQRYQNTRIALENKQQIDRQHADKPQIAKYTFKKPNNQHHYSTRGFTRTQHSESHTGYPTR